MLWCIIVIATNKDILLHSHSTDGKRGGDRRPRALSQSAGPVRAPLVVPRRPFAGEGSVGAPRRVSASLAFPGAGSTRVSPRFWRTAFRRPSLSLGLSDSSQDQAQVRLGGSHRGRARSFLSGVRSLVCPLTGDVSAGYLTTALFTRLLQL